MVPFNGGELRAHSGSIRMEGMQCFASKIRNFACNCLKDGWMEKLSQTLS